MTSKTLGIIAVLFLSTLPALHAGSNNGYTTAANVYSGSASRSWFGGGTAYAIAQWKAERAAASASTTHSATATSDNAAEASQTPDSHELPQ